MMLFSLSLSAYLRLCSVVTEQSQCRLIALPWQRFTPHIPNSLLFVEKRFKPHNIKINAVIIDSVFTPLAKSGLKCNRIAQRQSQSGLLTSLFHLVDSSWDFTPPTGCFLLLVFLLRQQNYFCSDSHVLNIESLHLPFDSSLFYFIVLLCAGSRRSILSGLRSQSWRWSTTTRCL